MFFLKFFRLDNASSILYLTYWLVPCLVPLFLPLTFVQLFHLASLTLLPCLSYPSTLPPLPFHPASLTLLHCLPTLTSCLIYPSTLPPLHFNPASLTLTLCLPYLNFCVERFGTAEEDKYVLRNESFAVGSVPGEKDVRETFSHSQIAGLQVLGAVGCREKSF